MGREILAYSDDVTGALDVAGSFFSRGYRTSVQIEQNDHPLKTNCRVFNLNSRYENPEESAKRLMEITNKLEETNMPIFLKVDSTLRGNIINDSRKIAKLNNTPVFIAPAFPFYGRTCINGVYLVKGIPITSTEFAKDSSFHQSSSFLRDGNEDITHINFSTLEEGIAGIIKTVANSQNKLFTFDTRDQADLELIADTGIYLGANLVGSSGLARGIPKKPTSQETFQPNEKLPVLFVAGSNNDASRKQIDTLIKAGINGVKLEHKDIENINSLERIRNKISQYLQSENAAFLTTPNETLKESTSIRKMEAAIATASNIFDNQHNLVIVGGESARAVLHSRNIKTLFVRSEFEEGIPISTQQAGQEAIITKAGGFGHNNTLVDIHKYLQKL